VRNRPGVSRRTFIASGVAALAAPALAGCGLLGEGSAPRQRLTARPGAPVATPELGLRKLALGSGRDGNLYVPHSYSPDVAMPLFVALHGFGGSCDNWAGYYEGAEARGFVLLAADSRAETWDLVLGEFGPDVYFLDQALRLVFQRCRIDPAKIALAGFSDGASYALSLGVSNGDLFTHLIAYSPGFYQPSSPFVGRPPIYVAHGTRDANLPIAATRDGIVPRLRAAGYDVTFREFDGIHEIPAAIGDESADWFLGTG